MKSETNRNRWRYALPMLSMLFLLGTMFQAQAQCTGNGIDGTGNGLDYTWSATNGANPTFTFDPQRAGVGSNIVIGYFSVNGSGYAGYTLTANGSGNYPFTLTAASGATVSFYYTYSVPEGGERNSAASPHQITVGQCGSSTVSVTGVSVSPTSLNLNVGQSGNLSASIAPSNATNQGLSWSSSNTGVATVNGSGQVSAVSAGSATITATTNDGGYTASASVTVNSTQSGSCTALTKVEAENWTSMAGVQTEGTSDAGGGLNVGWIDAGDWMVYNVSLSACTYEVRYRVASPSGGGQIQLEVPGGGSVYAVTNVPATGGWQNWTTVTQEITVPNNITQIAIAIPAGGYNLNWIEFAPAVSTVPVSGVSLSQSSLSLSPGQSASLTASVSPGNATDASVSWSSSNPGVASVSNGTVSALSAGTATITVTTNDGGYTASASVTVTSTGTGQKTLVWSDEFTGSSLNANHWTMEDGNGCPNLCSFGNQELQAYTNRSQNVHVANGKLVITARRENYYDRAFTSGKLTSAEKVNVTYGVVEASIKLPDLNNGLWPAFWMLHSRNNWPYTGEIDIMEAGHQAITKDANEEVKSNLFWRAEEAGVDANLQYGNEEAFSFFTGAETGTQAHEAYWVYRMYWTPTLLRTTILQTDANNEPIESTEVEMMRIDRDPNNPTFDNEFFDGDSFYIILNMAVGGWFPFDPNNGENNAANVTALPNAGSEREMSVEYVRVYSLDGVGGVSSGPGYANAESGPRFGIFTDGTSTNSQMTYGTDGEIWAWSGGATLLNSIPSPHGDSAFSFTFPAGTWSGMGFNSSDVLNLSNFIGGTLRFKARTSSQEPFRIHSWTRTGGREITWAYGENKYGLVRDGQWHDVEVPLNLFVDNLYEVIRPFQLGEIPGNAPGSDLVLEFDEVYYAAPGASREFTDAKPDFAGQTGLSLYPNPATDRLTVQGLGSEYKAVSVYGLDGRMYLQQALEAGAQQAELDLTGLQSGVYLLRLQHEGGMVEHLRFVKQ